MRNKFSFGVVLVLAALGSASVLHAASELANINGTSISLEGFNQKYKENLKFFQFKAPSKKDVLDDLIKRELAIQEAKKLGLDKDPEIVDRMNTVLYHAVLDRKLSKEFESIHVEDAEAEKFYSKNPEVRTSHIYVAVKPDAKPEEVKKAMDRMHEIEKELKAGKMSFAEVAQKYSEGVAAPMGGDIDYQGRDKLDPKYYETARGLKPGKVSDIVRSAFGLHIIKLTAVRTWEDADRPQIKRMLFEEKRSQIFDRYMTQLRNQAKVKVNAELLKD